jgi:hypothetical protein
VRRRLSRRLSSGSAHRQEAIPAARSVDGLGGRAGSALSARRGTVSRPRGRLRVDTALFQALCGTRVPDEACV